MWSFNFITLFALETVSISGSHVKVRSLELVVFLVVVDDVRDRSLLVEATLVNGVLGEVRFDDVKFA